MTGCFPLGYVAQKAVLAHPNTPAPMVTTDQLRPGEPVRVWRADDRTAVNVRFDSTRSAVLFYTRSDIRQWDSISLRNVSRLDVQRGTTNSPRRAFWMSTLWPVLGVGPGFLIGCASTAPANSCQYKGMMYTVPVATVLGMWWGMRSTPRWVTVSVSPTGQPSR